MSKRISVPDLLPDTTYALRVRVKNGDAVSDWSPVVSFTTVTDDVLPSIPTGVAWYDSGDSFHAEWDTVTTNENGDTIPITRYEVELNGTAILSVPQTVDGPVVFDFSFEQNRALFGADPSIDFRVRAVDNKELKSDWSGLFSATNPAPSAVTSLSATGHSGYISVAWTAPTDNDIVGYHVYVGATLLSTTLGTTYTYNTVNYAAQTITVRAVDKFGQEGPVVTATGTAINPFIIDTTPPNNPDWDETIMYYNPAATAYQYELTWIPYVVPDLAGFQIRYRPTGSGSTWESLGTFAADQTTTIGLLPINSLSAYDFQIRAFDKDANYSEYDDTTISVYADDLGQPSKPAAPTVSSNTQRIQVVISGLVDGGSSPMEAYVTHYEVYAGTSNPLATTTSTLLGIIPVGPAMVGSWQLPASGGGATQNWFVKIRAIGIDGQFSPNSTQVTATPGLITSVNIQDATITNAKIADLSVDKLTAGDLTAAAVTIKTTLTMGSAATNGYIQSYNYSPGTSGYRITKNSIEIIDGTIKASAITLTSTFNDSVIAGTTTIDGGKINTGQIRSNATSGIDSDPLWYINLGGAAVFENLTVRGSSVVGKSGDGVDSLLASYGYVPGSTGWGIYGDGTAEFRDATVRGAIIATSGSFTGNVDVTGSGKLRALGTGSARIEFNSSELAGYNTAGTKMTSINGATGLLTATDAVVEGTIRTGVPSGSPNTINYIQIGDYLSTGFISFFTGDTSESAEGKIWSGISTAAGTGSNRATFMTLVSPTLKNPSNVAQPEAKLILNGARQGHVAGTADGKHGWVQAAGEMVWLDTSYGDQWGTYITGGTIIGTTGTKTGQVNWGVATATVSGASGLAVVSHGAGSFTPSAVFLEVNNATYAAYVTSHNVGGFTIEIKNKTTDVVAANGTAITLRYLCLFA